MRPGGEIKRSMRTLDHRLSAFAKEHPQQTAVVDDTMTLTLGDLDRRIDALAARIRAVAGSGARVAVLLERGVDSVAAAYAVWRADCTYVPLEPTWPRARIEAVLDAADVAAVIDGPAAGCEGVVTVLERSGKRRSLDSSHDDGNDDNVAYLIHTSGSTGSPKGVQISHDSLLSLVDNHQRLIYDPAGVTDGPVAMVASVAFDSSIERLALVASGYCLHVVSDGVRLSPERLITYLSDNLIVNADLVPSHLRVLIGAGLLERAKALRLLIVGGEAFDVDLWDTVAASGITAFNVYGPTENTVNTSIAMVNADDLPNIGRPLPGVHCFVVGSDGRTASPGEPGELVVGGAQVSLGYFGEAELTARSFRAFDGERCYWTGDLVRLTKAGVLEFIGRIDDQVKVSGNRIELDDVVHHLRSLPGVREAAVTPVDTPGGTKLLASVVLSDISRQPNMANLRTELADSLPSYMVPAHWMTVQELPLTPNLKRDHHALRALWSARDDGRASATDPALGTGAPDRGTEQLLQRIWADVLPTPVTDRTAHFFAVGGDSLAVMELIVRVQSQTGVELDLSDVIKSPTIAKMADLIVDRLPTKLV